MRANSTTLAILAMLATSVLFSTPAHAQVVRARILQGIDFREARNEHLLKIGFTAPVQYLRHAPPDHGDLIEIQLELIAVSPEDEPASLARESLRLSRRMPVPLTSVTYDGTTRSSKTLELRFSEFVRFKVEQGRDFRSIIVRIEKRPGDPSAPRVMPSLTGPATENVVPVKINNPFAVQLLAATESSGPAELAPSPLFDEYRVYTTKAGRQGQRWIRVRLGFFATREEAQAAVEKLAPDYPKAAVVRVSGEERVASRGSVVGGLGSRETPTPTEVVTRKPEEIVALTEVQAARSERWIAEARKAMTANDLPAAINRLTAIISLPENRYSQEALELLGLARERNGQLAHAKAEYEAYLERYPDGEGSRRVHQRLDALLTARTTPRDQLRKGQTAPRRYQSEVVGSLASSYYRAESFRDLPAGIDRVRESSIFTDIYLSGYLRNDRLQARTLVAGSHRRDLRGEGRDEVRFSSLLLKLSDEKYRVETQIGRQSQSGAGVLGRFDGVTLSYRFHDVWSIAMVGGFPVDSTRQKGIDTRQHFVGGSIQAGTFFDSLTAELFVIGQRVDDISDRIAVGGELRYWTDSLNLTSYIDYDVHFKSLNIAYLVGNWQATDKTTFNVLFDYRNTPIITARAALQGQGVTRIRDLRRSFTEAQIINLALDRTGNSKSLTLGASHRFNQRFQISGNVLGTQYSGTKTSAGVIGIDNTSYEFSYFTQLVASNLFMDDDIETFGLRYFEGNTRDTLSVWLSSRFSLNPDRTLRLYPRMTIDYQMQESGARLISLSPRLRLDYRIWKLSFDVEGGVVWTEPIRRSATSLTNTNRLEYLVTAGLRLDF